MCDRLDLDPYCGKSACPAWNAWSIAVQESRLIDVSATARPLGFLEPVALSAPLWGDLQEAPRGTEGLAFPRSLEALLSRAFQILQLSQTPTSTFSFRLPFPARPQDDLAVMVTNGVKKEGQEIPLSLFRRGEPLWFTPEEDACAPCDYPMEVSRCYGGPLRTAIPSHPGN